MNPIQIRQFCITDLDVDCIVNAAAPNLDGRQGVSGMIFADAGEEELRKALKQHGPCPAGSAIVTPGFWLAAKYIIHAVGPQWKGGNDGEKEQLYSCYQTAMRLPTHRVPAHLRRT